VVRNKWRLVFALIISAAVLLFLTGSFSDHQQLQIPRSVYINQVDVGGLTAAQAEKKLSATVKDLAERKVYFELNDSERWASTAGQIGIWPAVDTALEKAAELGRNGSLWKRLSEKWRLLTRGIKITIPVKISEQHAQAYLQKIEKQIAEPPVSARYISDGSGARVVPHKTGRKLAARAVISQLKRAAAFRDIWSREEIHVRLVTETVPPQVSVDDIRGRRFSVSAGAYTTAFDAENKERVKNIKTACRSLNGVIIPPGGLFSFNEAIGPRTKDAGFKESLIIVENEFVPGLGGGVCQVSSTLYNAALRAGMEIVERSRHSRLITYVPVGLDAAVAYGLLDLKFRNTSGQYMVINPVVTGDSLRISLVSEEKLPEKIEIRCQIEEVLEPEIKAEIDPGLSPGTEIIKDEGARGYRTRVERVFYSKGEVVRQELVSRDFYPPRPKIILRGPDNNRGGI